MRILAVDPGTIESGWVVMQGLAVLDFGVSPNQQLIKMIDGIGVEYFVQEMVACYGMPVGAEVFETCTWLGKFENQWEDSHHREPCRLYRRDVKLWLCNSMKAKDANIRQAVINKYPPTGKDGKGNPSAIGVAKHKGPLYGIQSHVWQALALGITFQQTRQEQAE